MLLRALPPRLGVGICIAAGLAGCAGPPSQSPDATWRVAARLLSSEGTPYGGIYEVVGLPSGRVLHRAQSDCSGAVSATVVAGTSDTTLRLVAASAWMRRNTKDREPGCTELDWDVYWSRSDVGEPAAYAAARSNAFSDTVTFDNGQGTFDIASAEQRVPPRPEDTIDFGTLRFRTAHAAVEILVTIEADGGKPWYEPVAVSGLPEPERVRRSDWDTNPYYRHIALCQQGSEARILLTRAGWRLLRANPNSLLRLTCGETPEVVGQVVFDEEALAALASGARTIRARCVMAPRDPLPDRPSLVEPPDWALGEASLAW